MKIFTPLALALAILCITSETVVAASKTSEAGLNVRGPRGSHSMISIAGSNSLVPVVGTDGLIAVVIITAATEPNPGKDVCDVASRRADSASYYNGDAPFGVSGEDEEDDPFWDALPPDVYAGER